MRKRTLARELALQALYQLDLRSKSAEADPAELDALLEERTEDPGVREYARVLLDGTVAMLADLDARIAAVAQNWKLDRIAPVDRCILRLALFEIMETPETPPKVAINEAINLAKKYSTEQSGGFVNGILDRVYHELIQESGST